MALQPELKQRELPQLGSLERGQVIAGGREQHLHVIGAEQTAAASGLGGP